MSFGVYVYVFPFGFAQSQLQFKQRFYESIKSHSSSLSFCMDQLKDVNALIEVIDWNSFKPPYPGTIINVQEIDDDFCW